MRQLEGILLFLLFNVSFGALNPQSGIIDDVTTIYRLDNEDSVWGMDNPVEIHARTNALGMAVLTDDFGFLDPQNIKQDLLCWHPITWGEKKCDWETNDFTWEPTEDHYYKQKLGNIDNKFKREVAFKCDVKYQSRRYYDTECTVNVLSIKSELNFYKVTVQHRSCYQHRCSSASGSLEYCQMSSEQTGSSIETGKCSKKTDFPVHNGGLMDLLWIEITNNKLRIWKGKEKSALLVDDNDNYLFSNSTKSFITSHGPGVEHVAVYHFQVLKAQAINSTLLSPWVTVDSRQFCLRVVFYTEDSWDQDQLGVLAKDSYYVYSLGTFRTNKTGWYSWKLESSLPEDFEGNPMQIVIKTFTASKINIQRIAACSVEDNEDIFVITSKMMEENNVKNIKQKAYSVSEPELTTSEILLENNLTSSLCQNGGVLTTRGCACPAGFTGANCIQGCGPNHFGQDCGGQCSLYERQCRQLLLCTPGAGCHCAPGYRGSQCDQECLSGSYGPDCDELCGECSEPYDSMDIPKCDRYTGQCDKCRPGFYPPYCKLKYAHFSKAPVLFSTEYNTITVLINFTKDNIAGSGEPAYYQVQYSCADSWEVLSMVEVPSSDQGSNTTTEIRGLRDGAECLVRVLLFVDDFNSYQGDDIPAAKIVTKCDHPDYYNYNITTSYYEKVNEGEKKVLYFSWNPYDVEEHWCPLVNYEVSWKAVSKWKTFTVEKHQNYFSLENVLPNHEVKFKVRAKTTSGYAPSNIMKTVSPYKGIYKVSDLKAENVGSNKADISWEPPAAIRDREINYTVSYVCVRRAACSTPCESSGSLTTNRTNAVFSPLLPASQYEVSVSADHGPRIYLYFGTLQSVPKEIPRASDKRPVRTNSSVTVFWEPAEVCTGFLKYYLYHIYQTTDTTKTISSGTTKKTNATFGGLQASTDYTVRVSVGAWDWNPFNYLDIKVSTTATVPEEVRNLAVYKRSRTMVGLRWAEPRLLYGVLEGFTVSYTQGQVTKSIVVQPQHCVVWPDLYCHTLEGLKSSQIYNITVSARNTEIHEDGVGVSVTGQTRESSPTAPENLVVVNVTSTSLGLQWEHPQQANGQLRSFLVSIEETEQFHQEQCCQIFPIRETAVTDETRYYNMEVAGLHPASTYSISVTGKTVGFGPSQTLTAATRPPALALSPPTVFTANNLEATWLPQTRLAELNNSHVYSPLIKSHILLVLSNSSQVESGVEDKRLKTLLEERISLPFYMCTEYNEGDTVYLGNGDEEQSQWGRLVNPELESGDNYQLAAVQISEYSGVLNIDVMFSSEFEA